jgi:hypothetical protein
VAVEEIAKASEATRSGKAFIGKNVTAVGLTGELN